MPARAGVRQRIRRRRAASLRETSITRARAQKTSSGPRHTRARTGPPTGMAEQIVIQLLNGLLVGAALALVAVGLAVCFGVLRSLNFAQGDFVMLGGYATYF